MAESISEGTLKTWLKQVGDTVQADEEVATIETDKVCCCVAVLRNSSCECVLRGGWWHVRDGSNPKTYLSDINAFMLYACASTRAPRMHDCWASKRLALQLV